VIREAGNDGDIHDLALREESVGVAESQTRRW
jgi:hypothetical protein